MLQAGKDLHVIKILMNVLKVCLNAHKFARIREAAIDVHVAMVTGYPTMVEHVKGILTFVLRPVEMEVAAVVEDFANVPVNGKEKHVKKMSMNVLVVNLGTDVSMTA